MANKKTAEIGKTRDGKPEFGEVYHAVVGKRLNYGFYPKFVEFEAGREFYELFAKVENPPNATEIHIAETANWIFQGYYDGIETEFLGKIESLAAKEKWSSNVPEAFQSLLTNEPKVLIWLRSKDYKKHRKITLKAAQQLAKLCKERGILPVFVGGKLGGMPEDAKGLWEFYKDDYKDDFFKESNIAKQLWCLNLLYENGGVLASVGMMSGAMDGLAMICGKKVVFLAKKEDASPRMIKVSMVVPALHWVELFYNGNFQQLSEVELGEIERRIWA